MKKLITIFLAIVMVLTMPGILQTEKGWVKAADEAVVSSDFTSGKYVSENMDYVANINSETEGAVIVNKNGNYGLKSQKGKYVYYKVLNDVIAEADNELYLQITYLDEGTDWIFLQYNSKDDGNYKNTVIGRNNTSEWITTKIKLTDAAFAGKQNNGASFRFGSNDDAGLTIAKVVVTKALKEEDVVEDKSLLLHGRTWYEGGELKLAWANSGFTFNFYGTGVTADITSTNIYELLKGYLNIYVDGALVPTSTIRLDSYYGTYTLSENLTKGEHTITVRKRNEAAYGGNATIGVSNIKVTDGEMVEPPKASKRRIEFVGDSITSGFGNLIQDGSGNYTTATLEGTMSYAALTGKAFGADTSVVSRSGIRFVRTDSGESMIDYYPQVSGLTGNTKAWEFGSGSDVVVINLGTNDNGATNNGVRVTDEYVQAEAMELLKLVREKNPNAVIIWAYGIMGNGRSGAIQAAVASMNDNNMYYLPLDVRNEQTEGLGIGGHPTVTTNINRSFNVVESIADKTGWDYNYDSQLATELWLLKEYDNETLKKYTHESASYFVAVRKQAEKLIGNGSTETLKAAVANLQAAKNALVLATNGEGYHPDDEDDTTLHSSAKVQINGYQISTTIEGYRTVYTISDPDNEVIKAGMIYGLSTKVSKEEMVVGGSNVNVNNYEATDVGKLDVSFSDDENAQSYARTMKFINPATASYFNAKWNVRAYAQLKDGRYVYSDVEQFTIRDVADYLYQNLQMNNIDSHNYLYNNILKVVDSSYKKVEFAWNNAIVKPGDLTK